jgi:hypothetical protein
MEFVDVQGPSSWLQFVAELDIDHLLVRMLASQPFVVPKLAEMDAHLGSGSLALHLY